MSAADKPPGRWWPFSTFAVQMVIPHGCELEFLAARASPCGRVRAGDIVRGPAEFMSLETFSHWRPLTDDASSIGRQSAGETG